MHGLTHFDIYTLLNLQDIYARGSRQRKRVPCWLESSTLRFHSGGSIMLSDSLHCFGACKHPMGSSERAFGFSSLVFRANLQLGSDEGSCALSHPRRGKDAGRCVLPRISGFLGRKLPTPQLAAVMMKGKQMQNEESGLREFFRSVCPGVDVW